LLTGSFYSYWAKENSETEGHDGRGLWWSKPRHRDINMESSKSFTGGVKGFEVLDLEEERKEMGRKKFPMERYLESSIKAFALTSPNTSHLCCAV
jgi:hypothetical protein